MDFVKIGNKHYNKSSILCVYKCDSEKGTDEYVINFVNGRTTNITEEEYNNILGVKKKKRIDE